MKADRTTALLLAFLGSAVLSFVVGWFTSRAVEPPVRPSGSRDRPAGPCGPDTLPDSGVCIPVASPTDVRIAPAPRP